MFVDEIKVQVTAGDGGNGMVAFRREKYVELGGPWGGNGGRGGDVILEVDTGLRTLIDFRFMRKVRAKNGEKGMSKGMHGHGAEDLVLKVPPGTVVYDDVSGEMLADLKNAGDRCIVANGGRGGRGNIMFATHNNPAPSVAENGEPGEEKQLRLELKLLADVGFVGFPSVGKSTLLSVISKAKPKIDAYHFTTLSPQLGLTQTKDGRSFVVADLPGLIAGAHLGAGLGLQFLRHIERTRVIVHVIDMAAVDGRDPYEDYLTIREELAEYNPALLERPQVIVANKMDLPDAEVQLEWFKDKFKEDTPIFEVSGYTNSGVDELLVAITDILDATEAVALAEQGDNGEVEEVKVFRHKREHATEDFFIGRNVSGEFVVGGAKIEKLLKMTNLDHYESLIRFARQMRTMGIDEALRARGAKDGDTIWILDFAFEFSEDGSAYDV